MTDTGTPDTQFGAFGKMPALGDFFRIRVGQDFVAVWDAWVQGILVSARQVLGEAYDDCYMTAPVWRFLLPPGTAGAQGVMGVLMPSVDRVGRQFPLTLVGPCGPDAALHEMARNAATFDALEALALAALGDDMTRDRLSAGLDAIMPTAPATLPVMLTSGTGIVLTGSTPQTVFADLALTLGPADLARSGVWATTVDGMTRIALWSGLPTGAAAAALFDMDAAMWTGSDGQPAETSHDDILKDDIFAEIGIGQG